VSEAPEATDPAAAEQPPDGAAVARTEYGEAWVYESIVGALPAVSLRDREAIAVQLGLFGVGVLVLGWFYAVPDAVVPGLVAVGVAGVGSLVMLRLAEGVRRLDPPPAFRRLLFGSSIEVVLTVLAFVALVTHLFVFDGGAGSGLLASYLGSPLPVVPTYLALLVLWDLCYRIGTSWWVAVAALWRARRFELDPETARAYRRLDALNVGFAVAQLALVPFLLDAPVLLAALSGHVVAVTVVEATAVALQRVA
jgi:hypothetical protein